MELTFIGAAHEVTGSCHLLHTNGKNILIDCGMEQGPDLYENQELPVPAGDIDYILLTHAHIDHSGLIPLLCKHGFKGQIITTFATSDLCNIMLRDSAHIQEFEAEWRNRKARRSGAPLYEPLYTTQELQIIIVVIIISSRFIINDKILSYLSILSAFAFHCNKWCSCKHPVTA